MEISPTAKPLVFISSSTRDNVWRERLKTKLRTYESQIEWWDDSKLETGLRLEMINSAIERAAVAVVLLSPNYVASKPARSELSNLAAREGLTLFPIVLHECSWRKIPEIRDTQIWSMAQPIGELSNEAADGELEKIAEAILQRATQRAPTSSSPPQFRFSKTAEEVLKTARSLAKQSGRAGITSSCLLFALADRADQQPDTSWFVRNVLDRTGRYDELFAAFLRDSTDATWQSVSEDGELLGQVSTNMYEVLKDAAKFAQQVSDGPEISSRHLFAALLVTRDRDKQLIARQRLKTLGIELPTLCREFREFIRTYASDDNQAGWDTILTPTATQTSSPTTAVDDSVRFGHITLQELFAATTIGKAMSDTDRAAFLVGAALAQWWKEPLNSMGVLLGYLLMAPLDGSKSETALAKAVWRQYVSKNPGTPVDEVNMPL